jgi:hypothetical protein
MAQHDTYGHTVLFMFSLHPGYVQNGVLRIARAGLRADRTCSICKLQYLISQSSVDR